MKRKCYACKKAKELKLFKKNKRNPSGYGYICAECSAAKSREYCRNHRKEKNLYQKERYKRNPEHFKRKASETRLKVKMDALNHYGNGNPVCVCCGTPHPIFLNIDHIDGGGTNHLIQLKLKGGTQFYQWLIRQGYPGGYQILCFNCNFAKYLLGVCPHQLNHPKE
jgi:hypothetical protein